MSQGLQIPNVLQLDWAAEAGAVTVTPRNPDRYSLKMQQAIVWLQRAGEPHAFDAEFRLLLNRLAEWLHHRVGVRNAFVTIRDGGLMLVVVTSSATYDEAFEDSLTELDIEIAKDVDLARLRLDVFSLPDASQSALESFLNPEFILEYASLEPPNAE